MEARACDSMNPKKSENNKQACLRVKAQNKNKKSLCFVSLFEFWDLVVVVVVVVWQRNRERERGFCDTLF